MYIIVYIIFLLLCYVVIVMCVVCIVCPPPAASHEESSHNRGTQQHTDGQGDGSLLAWMNLLDFAYFLVFLYVSLLFLYLFLHCAFVFHCCSLLYTILYICQMQQGDMRTHKQKIDILCMTTLLFVHVIYMLIKYIIIFFIYFHFRIHCSLSSSTCPVIAECDRDTAYGTMKTTKEMSTKITIHSQHR